MKHIDSYIIEKLKLNNDIKVNDNELIPTEEDFNYIDVILSKETGAYLPRVCEQFAQKIKSEKNAIKKYLAIIIESGSSLVKKDNWLCSFPGNYGNDFLLKAKKLSPNNKLNIDLIYDAWEDAKVKYKDRNNYDKYIKVINSCIESLLYSLSKGITYEVKEFDVENYSTPGKKFVLNGYDFVSVPFIAKYGKNYANCEITVNTVSKHYYSFIIDGTDYHTSSIFLEKLAKILNL